MFPRLQTGKMMPGVSRQFQDTFAADRRSVVAGLGATLLLAASPTHARGAAAFDLAPLERKHGGRLGLAMHDAASGRQVTWRGNERFAYCSTFKLFLAAAMFERARAGAERLERRVAIRRSDMLEHAPVTARAVGSSLPLLELMRAVVEQSDNPAANILIRELGGLAALRRWHASIGDRVTRLDRIELALNRVGPGDPRDTTAPAQAVANLRTLFASQRLPAADRGRLIQWMIDSPTGPNRIRAAAPRGAAVAHKTGTAGSYGHTNDIGLVWPRGRDKPAVHVAAYYSDATRIDLATRENVLSAAVRAGFAALGA